VKKKPVKSSKKGLYFVIVIGIVIIGLVVAVSYHVEQAKITGQRFGNNLEQIQSDLKKTTSSYESKYKMWWEDKDLTDKEILNATDTHIDDLTKIISRYDTLTPPQAFVPSVELFKRSTQSQLESIKLLKEWIETGDNATMIRSDELRQQSFEYEISALASFNRAKISNTQ
jgi:hypothetical protein